MVDVEVSALVVSILDPGFPEDFFSMDWCFPVFYPAHSVLWVERVHQDIEAYWGSSVQVWVESGRPESGVFVVGGRAEGLVGAEAVLQRE